MGQFVGYHIDQHDPDLTTPVATGATQQEVMEKTARRILSAGMIHGALGWKEQPELSAQDFATLTEVVDAWATKHGLAS